MTDDVRDSAANGDRNVPVTGRTGGIPPVWPQPVPVSEPTDAPTSAAPPPPAGAAPYPPPGYAASAYPPSGMQAPAPALPKAEQAAPWVAAVPAPRPPATTTRPVTPPWPAAPPAYGFDSTSSSPSSVRTGSGPGRGLLIVLAFVLVAGLAGGGTWFFLRSDASAKPTGPTTFGAAPTDSPERSVGSSGVGGASVSRAPTSSAVPTSTPASPTAMTEGQALEQLQLLRSNSLSHLVTDSRWVAQVASKSVGITDPLQTAANGTHTFYAVDILAESQAATTLAPPSSVLVLQSTDFGKRSHASDGQPYWVTVVDEGFGTRDAVKSWCASAFPTLTADQLADTCAARTLSPPHD